MVVNRSAPTATVVPVLVYDDAGKAADWLCAGFGFTERLRAGPPGGAVFHAQLVVGDGAIMVGREGAEFRRPRPQAGNQYVTIHVDNRGAPCESRNEPR